MKLTKIKTGALALVIAALSPIPQLLADCNAGFRSCGVEKVPLDGGQPNACKTYIIRFISGSCDVPFSSPTDKCVVDPVRQVFNETYSFTIGHDAQGNVVCLQTANSPKKDATNIHCTSIVPCPPENGSE